MPRTYTYQRMDGLRKALRAIPKEATGELRDAAQAIAVDVAGKAATRARTLGGVAKYVAPTIRAGRDRIPKVLMGGAMKLPGRTGPNQTVGNVMWGAEFGSRRFTQFPPITRPGRFLWRTVDEQSEAIMDRYGDALMTAVDKAAR